MGVRLMIVDDSSMMRNRIARACTSGLLDGVEVVAAARDGEEAVKACAAAHPHLVTMDLTMPRMDGIACIKALLARQPDLLILVISALSDKATAIQALKQGAHGFLYKPFTDEALCAALRELAQEVQTS